MRVKLEWSVDRVEGISERIHFCNIGKNFFAKIVMIFKVLSLGEDVLPNYIMDKKIGQEDRWIILHYSPFKVNPR